MMDISSTDKDVHDSDVLKVINVRLNYYHIIRLKCYFANY